MRAVVLSSFPRSGNTWVRFVLATAMLGERPSSYDLNLRLPDAHRPELSPGEWLTDPALMLKSHFRPAGLTNYLQAFQKAVPPACRITDLKAVHIVRNPFDVALSVRKFYAIPEDQTDRFFEAFVNPAVIAPAEFGKWGFGNWAHNSREWLQVKASNQPPVHLVRYEDLISAPEAAFGRLFDWIGLAPKLPLAACLELCAPQALRRLEDREVAKGDPGLFGSFHEESESDRRFINGASAGGYQDVLSPAQIDAGLSAFGPLMTALGYDADAYRMAA